MITQEEGFRPMQRGDGGYHGLVGGHGIQGMSGDAGDR